MPDNDKSSDRQDSASSSGDDPLGEPFAYRDVSEKLPNEALRTELETMTEDEREAYLKHLEELSRQYLGPGGP